MLKPWLHRSLAVITVMLASMALHAADELAAFNKVTISVAGKNRIHPGSAYRVVLRADDSTRQRIRIEVEGDTLRVYCPGNCGSLRHDGVDVYVPSLSAVHLLNGGAIELDSGWHVAEALELTVHNGGTIRAGNLAAQTVKAEVLNGGRIALTACTQLDARIRNGGEIEYAGIPKLTKDIINGGNVSSNRASAESASCDVATADPAH